MSAEAAVMDFFNVCNALYKYCKKPTITVHYKGERLKRLLEQRWTGHLATVSVLLNNYKEITSLLTEIDSRHLLAGKVCNSHKVQVDIAAARRPASGRSLRQQQQVGGAYAATTELSLRSFFAGFCAVYLHALRHLDRLMSSTN
ncbi:hypothetical protein QQF64_031035 [Cirrhinus molitorella]|uniref:Uncharacterized protein n=1 Tax=Cirrhinus molitorella TaxID=172907 RepID=A0ABR3N556_9TELE